MNRSRAGRPGQGVAVQVVQAIERAGGVMARGPLVAATSRAEVDAALRSGAVVASGYGRYTTAATDRAVAAAQLVNGVLSHTSAALHHGWEVKVVPGCPHVTVPHKRRVPRERRGGLQVHWSDLHPDDVLDGVATSHETTLRQCLSQLPFDEALAVADSALRHHVSFHTLRRAAASVQGPGARQARRVAALADGDAANPFESALRAIALQVAGLHVVAQAGVELLSGRIRPDLVDAELRIVLEADSFEWHGSRAALSRDARRYNELVAAGWVVLRFSWEQVMFEPAWVRDILEAVVSRQAYRCGCVDSRR